MGDPLRMAGIRWAVRFTELKASKFSGCDAMLYTIANSVVNSELFYNATHVTNRHYQMNMGKKAKRTGLSQSTYGDFFLFSISIHSTSISAKLYLTATETQPSRRQKVYLVNVPCLLITLFVVPTNFWRSVNEQ